jgi:hypothetical protein
LIEPAVGLGEVNRLDKLFSLIPTAQILLQLVLKDETGSILTQFAVELIVLSTSQIKLGLLASLKFSRLELFPFLTFKQVRALLLHSITTKLKLCVRSKSTN